MKGVTLKILPSVLPSFPYTILTIFLNFNLTSFLPSFFPIFLLSFLPYTIMFTLPLFLLSFLLSYLSYLLLSLTTSARSSFLPSFLPDIFLKQAFHYPEWKLCSIHSCWGGESIIASWHGSPQYPINRRALRVEYYIYILYRLIKYNITQLHYNNLTVQLFDTFSEVIQFVLRLFKALAPHPFSMLPLPIWSCWNIQCNYLLMISAWRVFSY